MTADVGWAARSCESENPKSSDEFLRPSINGYARADFNSNSLTEESLHHACRLSEDGVEQILATIITDSIDLMCQRIRTINKFKTKSDM